MNYTVLMGDIVKSRQYMKSIDEAQDILRNSLYFLNKQFKKYIKAEARIQRGDEFQVLIAEPQYGFLFYRLLELLIFPLNIRCSMYVDEIYDTAFKSTERMYGDAYLKAGILLDCCKEENKVFLFGKKNNIDDNSSFIVNAMANNRKSSFVRGSTVINNNVQIIAEMLYPLTLHKENYYGNFNMFTLESIFDLKYKLYEINSSLKITNVRYLGREYPQQYINNRISFELLEKYCSQSQYTCGVLNECGTDEYFLNSCWKRGFNVKIAEILNTQRQTIDRAMNYLNFAEKRNYDGAIISMLNNIWENLL